MGSLLSSFAHRKHALTNRQRYLHSSRFGDARSVAGVSRCGRSCGAENLAKQTFSPAVNGKGVVTDVCQARVRVSLASSLGNKSVVPLPLPAHETAIAA